MTQAPGRRAGRRQLILIAAVFLGPLAVAAWLYFQGGALQPAGRTNHGALLEPIVNLHDALPEAATHEHNDQTWLLVYPNAAVCDEACRDALYKSRQSRLMLGREMDRVQRIFLRGKSAPDKVFMTEEHQDLIALEDSSLDELLTNKKPAGLPAGGYFLIDPLGNLVIYFPPGLDPAEMVDDIKRLLKLSRIG